MKTRYENKSNKPSLFNILIGVRYYEVELVDPYMPLQTNPLEFDHNIFPHRQCGGCMIFLCPVLLLLLLLSTSFPLSQSLTASLVQMQYS